MSPAPKGHPLWGNPLNPKKYTPEELWEKALDYFKWADENPWVMIEQSKMPQRISEKMALGMKPSMVKSFLKQTVELPHQRPYSIEALCLHINISRETFDNYSKEKGYETYFDICRAIRDIIDRQHLEGGMVGAFNANIVTRKLGLQEKIQSTQNIIISPMSKEEEEEIKRAMENAKKD